MRRVLVLGDAILDQTTQVRVKGISPESDHVLAVEPVEVRYNPGGAANVAVGVKALGGDPYLMGLRTADDAGRRLTEHLIHAKVPALLDDWHGGCTTVKERITTHTGQLLRIDRELPGVISSSYWTGDGRLCRDLRSWFSKPPEEGHPVLCLVDYDKGFFSNQAVGYVMGLVRETKPDMPVFVDPGRHGDWARFGSPHTIFKANLRQANVHYELNRVHCANLMSPGMPAADPSAVFAESAYKNVLSSVRYNLTTLGTQFHSVVLTLGAGGVGLVTGDGPPMVVPSEPVQVADPCGAGDTVMAMLAAFVARTEFTPERLKTACVCAEAAARVAVQKRGVHAVRGDEVGVNAWELLRHYHPQPEEAPTTSSPTGATRPSTP